MRKFLCNCKKIKILQIVKILKNYFDNIIIKFYIIIIFIIITLQKLKKFIKIHNIINNKII